MRFSAERYDLSTDPEFIVEYLDVLQIPRGHVERRGLEGTIDRGLFPRPR